MEPLPHHGMSVTRSRSYSPYGRGGDGRFEKLSDSFTPRNA